MTSALSLGILVRFMPFFCSLEKFLVKECTNLINREQFCHLATQNKASAKLGNSRPLDRKLLKLQRFLPHRKTWHSPCSFSKTLPERKETFYADADCYDVQKNSRASNPTAGFHLQALWSANLFTQFFESPPRGSQQKTHSIISNNGSDKDVRDSEACHNWHRNAAIQSSVAFNSINVP